METVDEVGVMACASCHLDAEYSTQSWREFTEDHVGDSGKTHGYLRIAYYHCDFIYYCRTFLFFLL